MRQAQEMYVCDKEAYFLCRSPDPVGVPGAGEAEGDTDVEEALPAGILLLMTPADAPVPLTSFSPAAPAAALDDSRRCLSLVLSSTTPDDKAILLPLRAVATLKVLSLSPPSMTAAAQVPGVVVTVVVVVVAVGVVLVELPAIPVLLNADDDVRRTEAVKARGGTTAETAPISLAERTPLIGVEDLGSTMTMAGGAGGVTTCGAVSGECLMDGPACPTLSDIPAKAQASASTSSRYRPLCCVRGRECSCKSRRKWT